MTIFETDRLVVRYCTEDDFESFFRINSDPEVMKYIRTPMSRESARELFDEALELYKFQPGYGRFAIIEKASGAHVGNFVLRASDRIAGIELGYAFLKPFWGLGYATEIVIAALEFAFERKTLKKVYAITDTENFPSMHVLTKTGFSQLPNITEKGRELCLFEKKRQNEVSS